MKRTSYTKHTEGQIYLKINQDFLHLCSYDHCEAALLGYYEYRYNIIRGNVEDKMAANKKYKPTHEECFIELSPKYLQEAMLGLFGRTKIIQANESLFQKGFIIIKTDGKAITKILLNVDFLNSKLSELNNEILKLGYKEHINKKKKAKVCSEMNNPYSESNKAEIDTYSETNIISMSSFLNNNKNNISSHSSDKDILLEEKQTSIVFEATNDLVSESLTKNIDANCTLPSQDSRKPRKTKKNEITEEELAIKAEKSQYTKEFKRLWYEKAKPKLEMQGYNAISKLYDKYGLDKANHIRDYILAMYGSNQLSIGKHKNHDDALMSYQDPNQETPKYLSNSLYERQSRYKGGDIPDDKMISSEATFYASLEWHFSDRYEGAELVKKVREFIKENNCKYKNY